MNKKKKKRKREVEKEQEVIKIIKKREKSRIETSKIQKTIQPNFLPHVSIYIPRNVPKIAEDRNPVKKR